MTRYDLIDLIENAIDNVHDLDVTHRDYAEAAADAVLAALPGMQVWRDIASAPRDGTWFWVPDDSNAISVRWHEGFAAFVSSWREMTFSKRYGGGTREHSPVIQEPKFWMPLLPAPKGDSYE